MTSSPLEYVHASYATAGALRRAEPRLTRAGFFFLSLIVLSFAYEIPLVYVSNFYKGNPYLFDVATGLLISYWLLFGRNYGWRVSLRNNPVLPAWLAVVAAFGFATLVSGTWVPLVHYKFSVFYYAKYVEGLVVYLIFFSAPLDERAKRRLLWVALLAGTWVAFYAVLQMLGVVSTARTIPKGWDITVEGSGIFSTLGTTYFHTGQYGCLAGLVGLSVFQCSRGSRRTLAGLLAAFAITPAIVSGSRAGFFALLISLGIVAIQPQFRRYLQTYVLAALLGFSINFLYSQSYTHERIEHSAEGDLGIVHRIVHGPETIMKGLKEHGALMVVAGGGFATVPIEGKWRHHYGVHNIHLYPFEQAGLLGFAAGMFLFFRVGTRLRRTFRPTNAVDEALRGAMFGYFVALMIVGWAGQVFWIGFGTEHLTIYQVLLFALAMHRTAKGPELVGRGSTGAPAPLAFGDSWAEATD